MKTSLFLCLLLVLVTWLNCHNSKETECTDLNCLRCSESRPTVCYECTEEYYNFLSKCNPESRLLFFYAMVGLFAQIFVVLLMRAIILFYKEKNYHKESYESLGDNNMIPQINKESKMMIKTNNTINIAKNLKINERNIHQKRQIENGEAPFIIVSNRSCDSDEECKKKCVQMYPLAPDGSAIKYKSDEFEFTPSGKLKFLNGKVELDEIVLSPHSKNASAKSVKKVEFLLPDDHKEEIIKEECQNNVVNKRTRFEEVMTPIEEES